MMIKNLFNFIKNNRLIFCILVFAQMITITGFFISLNYFLGQINTNKSFYQEMRTFTVNSPDTASLDTNLKALVEKSDYGIQHVYTFTNSSLIDLTKNKRTTSDSQTSDNANQQLFCGDYFGETSLNNQVVLGAYLSDDAENDIVLSCEEYYVYKPGDKYYINDDTYTIVGVSSDTNNYLSYATVKKYKIPVSGIKVVFKNRCDNGFADSVSSDLKELFRAESVDLPSGEYGDDILRYNHLTFFSVLLFSLSIFNFVYLYSFMLDRRKKQYAIFRIYGCTVKFGVFMYALECIVISVSTYLLSTLLYNVVLLPLLKTIDNYVVSTLRFVDYGLILIVYIAAVLLIVLPTIIFYSKRAIVNQYRN